MKEQYAKIGRFLHRTGRPLIKLYTSKDMVRVRVIVINEHDELLLVRSWFGHQKWSLPGGGKGRKETVQHAAARELREETGIELKPGDFTEIGTFQNPDPNAPFIVSCLLAKIDKKPLHVARLRRFEMLDVAWKPLKHLPEVRGPIVDLALNLLRTSKH